MNDIFVLMNFINLLKNEEGIPSENQRYNFKIDFTTQIRIKRTHLPLIEKPRS